MFVRVLGSLAMATSPRRLNLRRCVAQWFRSWIQVHEAGRKKANLVDLDGKVALIVDAVVSSSRLCDESWYNAVKGYVVKVTCGDERRVSRLEKAGEGKECLPSRQSCTKLRDKS